MDKAKIEAAVRDILEAIGEELQICMRKFSEA